MGLITQTAKEYYTVTNNFTGNGNTVLFNLTFDPLPADKNGFIVYQAGNEIDDDQYVYDANTGILTFVLAPTNGTAIQVKLKNIKHGSYRYIALDDIINNFMVSYVGDGKIIDNARKLDVLFHAKRAIQEFSYDVSRIEKIQEVEVGASLTIPMPQDYVNYTQLAWIDGDGLERVIYPSKITSRPSQSILQDDTAEYLYDNDESLLTATSLTAERFKNVPNTELNDDYFYSDNDRNAMLGEGKRFGIDPETTQINGVFILDEANGQFGFSSNLAGKVITLKYVSDGLGTDNEMQIHKLAEEAIYKYIAHAILSAKANIPEYIVNRFKRERRAAMRNAKLRLSNLKLKELTQVMRGKSKQIKH
jgi:hypothetical protein